MNFKVGEFLFRRNVNGPEGLDSILNCDWRIFLLVSLKELSKDVENTGWMGITKVAPRIKSERKNSER